MASERETIIAFVFNRAGKKEMSFSDFYLILSVHLNWFKPEEAKTFTKKAIKDKLLTEKKDMVTPGFNIDESKIPLGFHPSKQIFEDKQEKIETKTEETSILNLIIQKIVEESNLSEEMVFSEIQKIKEEKNITSEVASLLYSKEFEIDLKEFYDKIEKEI